MRFSVTASKINHGIRVLNRYYFKSDTGIREKPPKILKFQQLLLKLFLHLQIYEEFVDGEEKSVKLLKYSQQVPRNKALNFLASLIVSPSKIDFKHLDSGEHFKIRAFYR